MALLATACSSPDAYVPPPADERQLAVILGPPVAGKQRGVRWLNTVTSIDGKQVADPLADVRLAPGKHHLTLRCKQSKTLVLDAAVALNAIAGARYKVAVDHGRQRCVIVHSR